MIWNLPSYKNTNSLITYHFIFLFSAFARKDLQKDEKLKEEMMGKLVIKINF